MPTRIDAGTDVAMLGAWDAARGAEPLPRLAHAEHMAVLEADAEQGHLFLLRLGGDWGGPIDVFVDAELPAALRRKLRRIDGDFLVSVPSGRLVVGGIEDYRSAAPKITSESSVVALAPGDYALACYFAEDEEAGGFVVPPDPEMEAAIGADDWRYYRKLVRRSLYGYSLFALLPLFVFYFGWLIGSIAGFGVVGVYYYAQEQILLRNPRFRRVQALENEILKKAQRGTTPAFALTLRRIGERGALKGGGADFEAARS